MIKDLTQLFVTLATIIAQVGNFDKRRRRGGGWLLCFVGGTVFPAWINLNSDLLTRLLSRGSFVILHSQVDSHSNPREENRTNGPDNPIDDITIGVSSKPTTLPRWNPAIDIPTALARSWIGNHLTL